MYCPACLGPMKPLFTGFFCPRDCDKRDHGVCSIDPELADNEDGCIVYTWGHFGVGQHITALFCADLETCEKNTLSKIYAARLLGISRRGLGDINFNSCRSIRSWLLKIIKEVRDAI